MKNLKLFFRNIVSNPASIEGGRTKGWWWAVIIAVVSVLLAITPVFVTNITTSGTKFVDGTLYEYNYGTVRFSEFLYDNDLDFVIADDPQDPSKKFLTTSLSQWQEATKDNTLNRFEYKNNQGKRMFEVYYTDLSGNDFTNYATSIKNNKVPGSIDSPIDGEKDSLRSTSFIVFGKHNVISYLYSSASTNPIGSFYGDYMNLSVDSNLKNWGVFTLDGVKYAPDLDNDMSIYVPHVWNTWKSFFGASSHNTRMNSTWTTTGIIAAVDAGLVLFMGVVIFLLTRGKNNPFRIYTFWECQKIVYWASFTPGLLSLILGFMMSSYSIIFFVMFVGLRMMWMSMKNLRVNGDAPAPTNKK